MAQRKSLKPAEQERLNSSRFRVPSSHWVESSTLCANRNNISYSTEIHWCHKVNIDKFGHCTRKTTWWLLERQWKQKFVGSVDRFHEIHFNERYTSKRIYVVPGETDKNSDDDTSRSHLSWSVDKNWESRSKKRKTIMGTREAKTRVCQKFGWNLSCWSEWWRLQGHHLEYDTEIGNAHGPCYAMKENVCYNLQSRSRCSKNKASPSIWGNDEIQLYCRSTWVYETKNWIGNEKRTHEDHIAGEGQNSILHYNLGHKKFRCRKQWKFLMQRLPWTRNWRSLRQFQHGDWKKSKAKRRSQKKRHRIIKNIVHFGSLMDSCDLRNAELEPQFQKYTRRVCASRRYCELCLRRLRSVHWTVLIIITNDGRKSNGCHCSTAWMRRTSGRRNNRLYPGKNEGRSKIAQHSEVRMSWCLDAPSKAQMATIVE